MSSDILQIRRETRRRKILENSENRLKRITGRNEVKENIGLTEDITTITNNEVLMNGKFNCEVEDTSYFSTFAQTESSDSVGASHSEPFNSIGSTSEKPVNEELHSHNANLYQPSYLFYIFMAVLVRLLLEFDVLYICGYSVVITFLLVKCGVIGVYGVFIPETSRFLGSLLLSGISPKKVRLIILSISAVYYVLGDFALYIFVFVFSDFLIAILKYLL